MRWIVGVLLITAAFLKAIDYINMDVSQGNWVLLFHRYDCPKCQEALPKYEQLAMRDTLRQVAMIEVPPYDTSHEAHASPCPVAQLSDERDWFIQTPIEINLIDGVVENASAELPYLKSSSVTSGASKNIYIHTSLVQEHQHEKFGDSKL